MNITLISTNTFPSEQGLRTISACLKQAGHKVKIIFLTLSENYKKIYSKEILEQLKQHTKDTQLVGLSSMGSTANRASQIINLFQNNNVPVIWGGPHPTFFPSDCFKRCNIICVGEGEEAFVELAEKLEKKQDITKIKNLWIRINNKEYKNPVRPLIHNLDKLPHLDYDIQGHLILEKNKLIPFEEKHLWGMIFFQTERGCSQACTYCTNHIFKELYKGNPILRTHSVDYVIEELVRLKKKFPSIGVFDLRDETFIIRDIEWIRDFSKKYKEKVGIRFKCLADPASMSNTGITEEKLRLMVDAGLTDIIVGIQSGSDRLNFNIYKRYISADQVLKASQSINKFKNLSVMYDMMTTNPYETKEDILASINLLLKMPPPYYLSVNNLVFFEGTKLYDQAIKDGFIKENEKTSDINYWDRWKHIKSKKKYAYLNLVLNLMRGHVTAKRFGIMPRFLLKFLLKEKTVNFNLEHYTPTFLFGNIVGVADFTRENILKPLYKATPVNFKLWYDKVRYKA